MTDINGIVFKAIVEAERDGVLVGNEALTGYSGGKVLGLLQRIARGIEGDPFTCYAEIGVFQGLTLLSVASAAPGLPVYGIDNFSQFDPGFKNRQIVLDRKKLLKAANVELLDRDFEDALANFSALVPSRKIGLLFVDGPHDYRSQLLCILMALPHLADRAVVVIDDCNYEHVRLSTRDLLLLQPEFRLVFEAYTSAHPLMGDELLREDAQRGWWNGIHVLVREKGVCQRGPLPAFGKARERSLNEHIIQAHALADQVPDICDRLFDIATQPFPKSLFEMLRLLRWVRSGRQGWGSRPRRGNTYSELIAGSHLHWPTAKDK